MPEPAWELFKGDGGGDVVSKEITKCFKHDKRGRAQLYDLMRRLRSGEILGREVEDLGQGLLEAKLTYHGQEFRLFYSKQAAGTVLLALHVINKKVQRDAKAIALARKRLAGWLARHEG